MSDNYYELVEMIGQRKAVKVLREEADRKKAQAFTKKGATVRTGSGDPVTKEAEHEG